MHDPERDFFDPDHREPVELVGPIPPELAGSDVSSQADDGARRSSPSAPLRRFLLLVLALAVVVALVSLVLSTWVGG